MVNITKLSIKILIIVFNIIFRSEMMEWDRKEMLTQSQFTFLIIGFVLGPGFIQLPRLLVSTSRQDAWISAIAALIYPLYIIIISLYIIKRCPEDNIISVSKKYYGKLLGTILNIVFYLQFPVILASVSADISKVLLSYIAEFISPLKVLIVLSSISCYGVFKGIKAIGKVNRYVSFITLFVIFLSLYSLFDGSLLHLQPVFGSGFKNIIVGTTKTAYYYQGFEAILIFHIYLKDYKKIKSASFRALGIASSVWVWTVFICIYNMGTNLVKKANWPLMNVFESINVPIITNFVYFFMIAWSFIGVICMTNYYYVNTYIIESLTKIQLKKLVFALYPLVILAGILFVNISLKERVLGVISPFYVLFNCVFITTTALLITFKGKYLNKNPGV